MLIFLNIVFTIFLILFAKININPKGNLASICRKRQRVNWLRQNAYYIYQALQSTKSVQCPILTLMYECHWHDRYRILIPVANFLYRSKKQLGFHKDILFSNHIWMVMPIEPMTCWYDNEEQCKVFLDSNRQGNHSFRLK